jgi:hypothetical protein
VTCTGFADDIYALYALGLGVEGEDELRQHLLDECPTCHHRILKAAELWFVMGALTGTLEPQYCSAPSPALRERILRSIRTPSLKKPASPSCLRPVFEPTQDLDADQRVDARRFPGWRCRGHSPDFDP